MNKRIILISALLLAVGYFLYDLLITPHTVECKVPNHCFIFPDKNKQKVGIRCDDVIIFIQINPKYQFFPRHLILNHTTTQTLKCNF